MNFNQFRMTNSSVKGMKDVEVYVMSILLNEMYVGTRINLIPTRRY